MTVAVRVPHGLAWAADGHQTVDVDGSTLAEVWDNLHAAYPELMWRLTLEEGPANFILTVSVDGRALHQPLQTEVPLTDGSRVTLGVLPASGAGTGAASGRPPAAGGSGTSRG